MAKVKRQNEKGQEKFSSFFKKTLLSRRGIENHAENNENDGQREPNPDEGSLFFSLGFLSFGIGIIIRIFVLRIGVISVHVFENRTESIDQKIKGSEERQNRQYTRQQNERATEKKSIGPSRNFIISADEKA